MSGLSDFWGNLSGFQILTAVVAGLAASGSMYTIYRANWAPPDIRLFPAHKLSLVAPPGNRAPFNILLELANFGSKLGVLQFLEARVRTPKGLDPLFEWNVFYEYVSGEGAVQTEGEAHPISLKGGDRESKGVQFVLAVPDTEFRWISGDYEVVLRGWADQSSRNEECNVNATVHFSISERDARILAGKSFVQDLRQMDMWIREWLR